MTTAAITAPVISILMPTYNRLEFLRPAVASVFAQSFPHWELIIADDGSEADTRAYLRTLENSAKVRIIWRAHSGRPSAVINAALREARGEYIAFLDSDDLWLAGKLETQVASLRRHAARKWSCTSFALIDAAGVPRSSPRSFPAPSGWILEKMLREEAIIAQPSVVISRQALSELGPLDEDLLMCYDTELWLRLAAYSEIDGVDEVLTLVRRHSQHSGDDITAWRDRRRVYEQAIASGRFARVASELRRLRAHTSSGLAKSQAASQMRIAVLATLVASAPFSWGYREWWRGAMEALARAFAPTPVQEAVRRYRHARRVRGRTGVTL